MRKPFHYYYFCLVIDTVMCVAGTIAALNAKMQNQLALMTVLIFLTGLAGATFYKDISEFLVCIGAHPTQLRVDHFDYAEIVESIPVIPYHIWYVQREDIYYYDYWNIKGEAVRRKITPKEFLKYSYMEIL